MRFRKTVKIAPGIKLNLSKRGVSTTIGKRGLSINTSSSGTYLNTGIPGSGISSRRRISGGSKASTAIGFSTKYRVFADAEAWVKKKSGYNKFIYIIFGSFVLAFILPIVTIFVLLTTSVLLIRWLFTNAGKSTMIIRKARKQWSLGDSDKAIELLEKALSLYHNPNLIADIIYQCRINNKPEKALKYLNELEGCDARISLYKAECYYEIQAYPEAANHYAIAVSSLEVNQKTDNVYSKYGIACYHIGAYKQAIELLQKVSADYKEQSLKALLIGKCFYELRNYDSAIINFTNYMGHKRNYDSNMIEICYILGQIYLELGDKGKAKQWFNKVYAQDINYKDVNKLIEAAS